MIKFRVLIVDDHAIVRKGLRCILDRQEDLLVVAEAENGLEAVDAVDQHRPDAVIMDINMPKMDGLAATSIITSKYPQTRVIVLSMHNDDGMRVRALEAGACHFLSKDCNPAGILAVIRDGHGR